MSLVLNGTSPSDFIVPHSFTTELLADCSLPFRTRVLGVGDTEVLRRAIAEFLVGLLHWTQRDRRVIRFVTYQDLVRDPFRFEAQLAFFHIKLRLNARWRRGPCSLHCGNRQINHVGG